jgi:mRNA-degrading endonuclease toxin of MazEF toxin-antitoxin module
VNAPFGPRDADHRSFRVWDIVRVDFPFADAATTRRRPALVIATPPATEAFSILWLLMITSARHAAWDGDVPLSDLRLGGLSRACVVRTSKITTLDSRLAARIGELAGADRPSIMQAMRQSLSHLFSG